MKENEKFSEELKTHIDFFRNLKIEYGKCLDKIRECDLIIQDYLHLLEIEDLTYKERARIATQLRNCRRERRKYKDREQVLKPVVAHIKEHYKILVETLSNILGDVRKTEEILDNRVYHKRVPEASENVVSEDDKITSKAKPNTNKSKRPRTSSNNRRRKK
jgi:hypothetical protein